MKVNASFSILLLSIAASNAADSEKRQGPIPVPTNCSSFIKDKWTSFVCENENLGSEPPLIQPKCHSRYTLSGRKYSKGLIVAFQGFSPCPDSFDGMSKAWLEAGYDVMVPLLVGHGMSPGNCADPGSDDSNNIAKCIGGDRVDRLPLYRQGYIDWVDTVNDIVTEEVKTRKYKKVFAAGLSHGGPLASYAVITGKGLYDKMLLFNPFFGISGSEADHKFEECQNENLSASDCIDLIAASFGVTRASIDDFSGVGLLVAAEKLNIGLADDYDENSYAALNLGGRVALSNLVEEYDLLPEGAFKQDVNEGVVTWGTRCNVQIEAGRGGTCNFRSRNLLAAHSFSQFVLKEMGSAESIAQRSQFIETERDGTIRNSLTLQAAYNFARQGSDATFCMYRADPDCPPEDGNKCGVPHSMLSKEEAVVEAPYNQYWAESSIGNATRFFERGTRVGTEHTTADPFSGERLNCVQVILGETQPKELIIPPLRGLFIRVEGEQEFTLEDYFKAAGNLSDELGIAVYPAGTPRTALYFGSEIRELYFETADHQLTIQKMKYLESLFLVGDLNTLVEERVVVDLEFAGSREKQSRKKSPKKAKKTKKTKTKKIGKSPKMPKAHKSKSWQ